MEQYKKITKYWRNSLIDKKGLKGKYNKDPENLFLNNGQDILFRVNSKKVLEKLFSNKDSSIEALYIPFSFKKIIIRDEKNNTPKIIFPIILKVNISECGFIYPLSNPIIPRDLLLPLDKDDFFIGIMNDYDLFIVEGDAPSFDFKEDYKWEKYFLENIEPEYKKGLIETLLEHNFINIEQSKENFKELIKSISKNKQCITVINKYNENWDKTIKDKLINDKDFNKSIESYIEKWNEYSKYVDKLLDKIISDKSVLDNYKKIYSSYFTTEKILYIDSKIKNVYEDIYSRYEDSGLTLYKNYTTTEQKDETSVINSNLFFSKRLGHNNNKHPLADAQRTAVSSLIASKNGEILAVNGPPGTGKTTMLLSVVSCLWVEKALEEGNPPVIIATSSNNQAVTNIIDSFAKDFSIGEGNFAGRWIDNVNSFGCYFVSKSKGDNAKEAGYITEDVLKEMETEYFFVEAKKSYLEKSQTAFNNKDITLEESVKQLHKLLLEKQSLLNQIENSYHNYHNVRKELNNTLNVDYNNESAINRIYTKLNDSKDEINIIENKWDKYLASENIFLSVFSFLYFIKRKRNLKAKIFSKDNYFDRHLNLEKFDINNFQLDIKIKKDNIYKDIQKIEQFIKTRKNFIINLTELDENINPNLDFIEIDKIADTKIRFEMFLIATHYWEGRWLLDIEYMIEKMHLKYIDKKWENIIKNNWHRRMKITPCAVMTCFMLPDYFYFSRETKDKSNYLYDFIDLLIVDEAGQVPPEVAGAGFSLAKKALVIGDTLQIPPISSLAKSIDIGNLHKENLISRDLTIEKIDEAYKMLQSKGIASNGGSVMKISQNRAKYFPEKKLERGLYLYEHRRCYDSIIQFCNELCYKGVLKPMRGNAPNNFILPSIGYLNIEGKCQNYLGSKKNELEAKIIADWIINNYKQLRETYNNKEIKDIVAVVSPFREQSYEISKYLKSPEYKYENIKDELAQITVGTVHSLQGAERAVVLFSPTYSRHNKGPFIDNDKSMLNVAVSRAKDSFLVFGDMSLFNRESVSPTGILAKYIFENENNEITYSNKYSESFKRVDLISKEHPFEILTNHQEHDVFLKKIFNEATQRIIIISPWIIYSTINKNGYDSLLSKNNIEIVIYTDNIFNTHTQNKLDKTKEENFHYTLKKLSELGVEVKVRNNIHSKIVIKDNDCICIGSFNWFSAQRKGNYINKEHSIVYKGDNVKGEIENILTELN